MSVPESISKDYQAFFVKHEAGKYFMTELDRLIDDMHAKAEDNADSARDYTQSAKGIRLVENHIKSVMTEVKAK